MKKISEKSARPFNAEKGTFNGIIFVSRERTSPLRRGKANKIIALKKKAICY
ncbi:MAG: hypothetical protein E6Y55_21030 [Klebsiella michiganensis]|uniref:Uncharacterized protein n=1 Tax=Klebsiella grimontii TaxID=2058152 RepID=A0ABD7AAB3_9ENTR|nr:hypothetical protein [Klebsiella grimontii]MDU1456974.1 hypothetical protein [Klebsiella sp.]MDU4313232.1 hypothetical protein [Klebsiella michiganensis]MCW9469565.1 hypothetical protein [Klebsiella grimontii]MDD9699223.1 hypothetical protein [Klebsiella grimontii]MDG9846919.1 hypothetical protein [Klebsiella grimontii]